MQLSARTMIGIVSFGLAMTGIFLGNMFQTMMIGEINRKRQDGNLLSYVGYTFPKITRIFHEYRLLYPTGGFVDMVSWTDLEWTPKVRHSGRRKMGTLRGHTGDDRGANEEQVTARSLSRTR